MNEPQPRAGSLFSGYGGLDLAVEKVFEARTVWHSEIGKNSARVLAHHWPGVPNLGDITQINWKSTPKINILCGGFPCQDVSLAGKREGLTPTSRTGLWAHMAFAVDQLKPEWVVFENVQGLLSASAVRSVGVGANDLDATGSAGHLRALGCVLGDLAQLGYDCKWASVSAARVGAPHRRIRVFGVARRRSTVSDAVSPGPSLDSGRITAQARNEFSFDGGADHRTTKRTAIRGSGVDQQPIRWGAYAARVALWERVTGRVAPFPVDDQRLSMRFMKWLMGLPEGWVTRVPGVPYTAAQQEMLGNGVVPQQAEFALQSLLDSW